MNKYQEALNTLNNVLIQYDYIDGRAVSKDEICVDEQRILKELVDRATPMEFYVDIATINVAELYCPKCTKLLGYAGCDDKRVDMGKDKIFCPYCGQRLQEEET
jgi:DNA-directed RNA polymerase subunit RPC12/RpoP